MKDSIFESEYSIKEAIKAFKERGLEALSTSEKGVLLSLMKSERDYVIDNHISSRQFDPDPVNEKYEGKGYKGYRTFLTLTQNEENMELIIEECARIPNRGLIALDQVPKVKINEEYRNLFPELAESLEREGQLTKALRCPNGYLVDGEKRKLLLGDQLETIEVPIGTECSNMVVLTQEQKRACVLDLYNVVSNETTFKEEIINLLMKRYGLSRSTVYRIIDPSIQEEKKQKQVAKLKEHQERIFRLKNDLKGLESSYQEVRTNQSRENVSTLLMYVEMTIGHIRSL